MSLLDRLLEELLSIRGKDITYTEDFFSRNLAFRLKGNTIEAVKHPHIPDPSGLINIERQKDILLRNTEQFVKGLPANDILLWGSRGTGKSSLVKSTLKLFGEAGLRIIQLHKGNIPSLSYLYGALRNKPFRFILFFDDLSFEPHEEAFKLLKSLLEGDIEERPENILVYATSNRRHLIPDSGDEEKFPTDSLQERVSLVERFGIRLGFFPFSQEEYLNVLRNLLGKDLEKYREEALIWATERGSFSGRVAHQFYRDLIGRKGLR